MKLAITPIILAGGFGTRIKDIDNIPKPLVKLGKYNLLENNILKLRNFGIEDYIISIGYRGEKIKEYFGDGSHYNVKIKYCQDPKPLGDTGAFRFCYKNIEGMTLLVNSDDIRTGLNLEQMLDFHKSKKAISTVALNEQELIEDHAILELDNYGKVIKYLLRPSKKETSSNLAVSGLYIMEKEILNYIPKGRSVIQRVLNKFINSQKFYGFIFQGLYFNINNLEALEKAKLHVEELEQI